MKELHRGPDPFAVAVVALRGKAAFSTPAAVALCALLFLAVTTAAAQSTLPLPATEQVKTLFSPTGGGFSGLAINPQNPLVMYWALPEVGVLKSADGGLTWAPKNYGLPSLYTSAIVIDPDDPNHLLVAFEGNFSSQASRPYRSHDGGERWEPTVACEREDGKINLRQDGGSEVLLFDPTDHSRLYYEVHSCCLACGGFFRSCDKGASWDRNPRCVNQVEPRPACAVSDPEPTNNITSNDAGVLEVHPVTGDLFGTTPVHPQESGLATSRDKGGTWTWEDVLDTTGTFVDPAEQGINSLYLYSFKLAPSNPETRYAGVLPYSSRCDDGKAYPSLYGCPNTSWLSGANVVARWFGEQSGAVDCEGSNDCDGDPAPDRVWRPIFDARSRPSSYWLQRLLVHPSDPNRVFVAAGGSPSQVLMLTPVNPADLSQVPWQSAVLWSDSDHYFNGMVQDPVNQNRFYVWTQPQSSGSIPAGSQLIRFDSADGGQSWVSAVLFDSSELFRVNDIVETAGNDGRRIVAGTTAGVFIGDETGGSWTQSMGFGIRFAVAPADPDRVYSKSSFETMVGTGGFDSLLPMDRTLYRQTTMCSGIFNGIAVDPDDRSLLYAATEAGLWKLPAAHAAADEAETEAISHSWLPVARQSNGLGDEYLWSVAFDPFDATHNTMLAGTRSGTIYRSDDRGATWAPVALSVPPAVAASLRDVRDFRFQGVKGFAASGAGVLVRNLPSSAWTASLTGDRISRLAPGVTGVRRVYAAGDAGLYRTRDTGASWEPLPITPQGPFSAVMETRSRDGRHHLWAPDFRRGLYRVSTTVSARPGADTHSVVLDWTELSPSSFAGYRLHYGSDPDVLGGSGATEGGSPIPFGLVTSASLSGLDFRAGTVYVVLQGVGPAGELGPRGLPLAIEFGYVFSPRIAAAGAGPTCPAAVRVTWTAVPEATGYKIYRSTAGDGGPFALLASVQASATSYDDASITGGTSYWYYMTSTFVQGETTGGNIVKTVAETDFDGDGVENCADNCLPGRNTNQADADADGTGDACEDDDGDGFEAYRDNCPSVSNPGQEDTDGDAVGNVCDNCPTVKNKPQFDTDHDGRGNVCDNCLSVANPDQADGDTDGKGDVCDNCPAVSNASQANADGDTRGDACDNCPTAANSDQADGDADGRGNVCDNCPADANFDQANADGDARGDVCDCAPADATAFAVPGAIGGLRIEPAATALETALNWDSAAAGSGSGTVYDLLRGEIKELPVGSGSSETCVEPASADTTATDGWTPGPGSGVYYVVRGHNACGYGTYGADSAGNERGSSACP